MSKTVTFGCGCRTILLAIIAIALVTMCSRLSKKEENYESEKVYEIIYPNGDTILLN